MSLFWKSRPQKTIPILLFAMAIIFAGLFSVASNQFLIKNPFTKIFIANPVFAQCTTTGNFPNWSSCAGNGCSGYDCPYKCHAGNTGIVDEFSAGAGTCMWDYSVTKCDSGPEAQAYCNAANCKGQNQGCGGSGECCAGLTCKNGVCAGSCSGNESDATSCANNGGTWGDKTVTGCISNYAGWCGTDGCPGVGSAVSCGDTASCYWIPTGQTRTCQACTCPNNPPPATCNNNWSLTSQIGLGKNDAAQSAINGGNVVTCSDTTNMNWYQSATVNIPAIVSGGTIPVKSICVRSDASVNNMDRLNIADITNNVTIVTNTKDLQSATYRILTIKANNPGEVATIQSSRAQAKFNNSAQPYCAKTDAIAFCPSTLPAPVANGYPSIGQYVTDQPPQTAPDQEINAAADSNKAAEPLAWSHTLSDVSNGVLIVGVSYRGNKGFGNNVDEGDSDDYVKNVTIKKGTNATLTLTRIPNSHAQYIEGTDGGGKRHTSLWYILTPSLPTGTYSVTVNWKGAFPDPLESVGGSISYTGVDQSIPFNSVNKRAGKVGTCDANKNCANEPSITNSVTSSQTTLAIIAGQTDANYQNPPELQPVARTRWRRLTDNKNIYGQGADQAAVGTATPSNQTFNWKYGYTGATWAISSVVIRPALVRQPNYLYWQNIDWGAVCGTLEKHNYVTVLNSSGTKVIDNVAVSPGRASEFSLAPYYGTGANQINPSPRNETSYAWYVNTSNIAGGTGANDPRRVQSPQWWFKVKPGPNLTASSSAAPVVNIPQNLVAFNFRITNTGGNLINNAYANFTNTNRTTGTVTYTSSNLGPFVGGKGEAFNPWIWSDQGASFPLPPPGDYQIKVTTDPGNVVAETDETPTDNVVTLNYTVPPRAAYFQTISAGITSLGTITSNLPASTDALSKKGAGANIDAGIISAKNSPINKGVGIFSQSGLTPGWNRTGVNSAPRTPELSYANLYTTVLTNAGISSNIAQTNCGAPPCSYDSGNYKVYVYFNPSDINTFIASAPTTGTTILIPGVGAPLPTLTAVTSGQTAGKRIIVFVNGSLTVSGSVSVLPGDNAAGLVFIVKDDITVNDSVTQLDGVFIFSGTFNSNSSTTTTNLLRGNGSLVGLGANPFNLLRTYGTDTALPSPAELWTYQPKYLWLFRNILTQPSYSWKELPPQ